MAKQEVEIFTLPEGRVINCALFEKDVYTNPKGEAGKPSYKIEIAYDPADVEGENTFEDQLIFYAIDKWGDGAEQTSSTAKSATPFWMATSWPSGVKTRTSRATPTRGSSSSVPTPCSIEMVETAPAASQSGTMVQRGRLALLSPCKPIRCIPGAMVRLP